MSEASSDSWFGEQWDNFKLGGAAIVDAVVPEKVLKTLGVEEPLAVKVYSNQVEANPERADANASTTKKLANMTSEERADFGMKASTAAEEKAGGPGGLAKLAAEATAKELAEKAKSAGEGFFGFLKWGGIAMVMVAGLLLLLVAWVASKVLPAIVHAYLPPPRKDA